MNNSKKLSNYSKILSTIFDSPMFPIIKKKETFNILFSYSILVHRVSLVTFSFLFCLAFIFLFNTHTQTHIHNFWEVFTSRTEAKEISYSLLAYNSFCFFLCVIFFIFFVSLRFLFYMFQQEHMVSEG